MKNEAELHLVDPSRDSTLASLSFHFTAKWQMVKKLQTVKSVQLQSQLTKWQEESSWKQRGHDEMAPSTGICPQILWRDLLKEIRRLAAFLPWDPTPPSTTPPFKRQDLNWNGGIALQNCMPPTILTHSQDRMSWTKHQWVVFKTLFS